MFQITEGLTMNQVSNLQIEDLKDLIILDSASSAHVFCNKKMVEGTRDADEHLALAMNGGPFQTSKKANVPGCDEVWMNRDLERTAIRC